MKWLFALLLVLWPTAAWAHKPSDAILDLQFTPTSTLARWEVALRDLEILPGGLDDGDGALHRSELTAKRELLFETMRAHVRLASGGAACTQDPGELDVTEHSDGAYAALSARVTCARSGPLSLDYDYLFDADPQHRLIVHAQGETHVLSSQTRAVVFERGAPARASNLLGTGFTHILEGTDHLLFLISLLLPAVLLRRGRESEPAPTFRPVFFEVLRVVTAFTVAHSLTLSLAVLGFATLPARLVEPAIAATVVVAAAANLLPVRERSWLGGARWPLAYALGLLHGYGFSSALDDAGIRGREAAIPLFTFNLGVELGQLSVVIVVLPLLFVNRRWRLYEPVVLRGCSVVVALIACFWLVERAFDVKLLG